MVRAPSPEWLAGASTMTSVPVDQSTASSSLYSVLANPPIMPEPPALSVGVSMTVTCALCQRESAPETAVVGGMVSDATTTTLVLLAGPELPASSTGVTVMVC